MILSKHLKEIMFSLLFLLLLLVMMETTIWMTFDAKTHRIPVDKKPYGLNNGALAWFLIALLLWVATFPYYLWKRSLWMNDHLVPDGRPVPPIASPHSDERK